MAARGAEATEGREKIGALCVEIAGIVFPHFTESDRREKLAVALIDFSRRLLDQAALEAARRAGARDLSRRAEAARRIG